MVDFFFFSKPQVVRIAGGVTPLDFLISFHSALKIWFYRPPSFGHANGHIFNKIRARNSVCFPFLPIFTPCTRPGNPGTLSIQDPQWPHRAGTQVFTCSPGSDLCGLCHLSPISSFLTGAPPPP